jgi:hypothetical protein
MQYTSVSAGAGSVLDVAAEEKAVMRLILTQSLVDCQPTKGICFVHRLCLGIASLKPYAEGAGLTCEGIEFQRDQFPLQNLPAR